MEIHDILFYGMGALLCFVFAICVKSNRQAVLRFASELIQKAEQAIQGSGMGADKKALVIAQLQAAGIHVGAWLDKQIDVIVASLNSTGAWLATQTQQGISGLNDTTQPAAKGGESNE